MNQTESKENMSCTVCGDFVTNPICKDCLSTQMKTWFDTKRINNDIIEDASVIFNNLPVISKCVKCGNDMTVCRHCFTKEVHDCLIEKHPEFKEDFNRMFNYEIYEDW